MAAVSSMLRLNRLAAAVAREAGVRGATDITGFGLLGHLTEMIEASGVGVVIDASRLPLLPGALAMAEAGQWSGGMRRNRRHVEAVLGGRLVIDPAVPAARVSLLFEAETSGGLLFSAPPSQVDVVRGGFERGGEECAEMGEVTADPTVRIV
jgi:selenide,water dikinase